MANKYSRLKPKIKPLPFIILGVIIVVITISVILLQPNTSKQFYETYKIDRVEEDNEGYLFKDINLKTLNKMVEREETFLVYFGYPSCSNCMSEVKNYYNEFFEEGLNEYFDNIYYINLTKLKEKEFNSLGDKYGIRLTEDQQTFNAFFFYIEKGEIKLDRNSSKYQEPLRQPAGEIRAFYQEVKEFVSK